MLPQADGSCAFYSWLNAVCYMKTAPFTLNYWSPAVTSGAMVLQLQLMNHLKPPPQIIYLYVHVNFRGFAECPCLDVNVVYSGTHLDVLTGVASAIQCQTHCQAQAGCLHFSYHTSGYKWPNECWLKSSSPVVEIAEYGVISGPRHCPYPGLPGCPCFETDVRYVGTQLDALTGVADARECQARCQARAECQFFAYNTLLDEWANECWLMALGEIAKVDEGGIVSGPKHCPCEGP